MFQMAFHLFSKKKTGGKPPNRSIALDILRAVAICLVLGRHMVACPDAASTVLHQITGVIQCGGWVGVDLFFVLSGFLVSGLLFNEYKKRGNIHPWHFLVRRGLKIYPAFYVFLIISLIRVHDLGGVIKWKGVMVESLFLTSYLRTAALFNHTWSLGVEEHFYFILPLLFLFLIRKSQNSNPFRLVPAICIYLFFFCLLSRIANESLWPDKPNRCFFQSHCRFDSLFFGVMLSYFSHFHHEKFMKFCAKYQKLLLVTGLICFIPPFAFPVFQYPLMYTAGFSVFMVGGGCFLMTALSMNIRSKGIMNFFAYIGSHSYSIYLWHEFAAGYIGHYMGYTEQDTSLWRWLTFIGCYVVGAIGLGILMGKIVEFPVLALRDRLYPSRS
jgi:peptidoglycan/LPS O-acetylase OafA/YrhL